MPEMDENVAVLAVAAPLFAIWAYAITVGVRAVTVSGDRRQLLLRGLVLGVVILGGPVAAAIYLVIRSSTRSHANP